MIFSLTTAVLLATALHTAQSSTVGSLTDVSDVETTSVPSDEELSNKALNAFQTTEYAIVDFAKLGYEIFKEKLFSALAILDTFMQMKPAIIKITRTFIFGNDTDLTNTTSSELNNETGYLLNEQSQLNMVKPLETNTESPLENDLDFFDTEPSDPVDSETEISFTNKESDPSSKSSKISHGTYAFNSQDEENQFIHPSAEFKEKNDQISLDNSDIQKTKIENEGFFGKMFGGMGNFFLKIWNWF